jgi:hypothetical protein
MHNTMGLTQSRLITAVNQNEMKALADTSHQSVCNKDVVFSMGAKQSGTCPKGLDLRRPV